MSVVAILALYFFVSDRYQILRDGTLLLFPSCLLFIVHPHTIRINIQHGKDKKLQPRTNRELAGVRGLVSLNSEHSNRLQLSVR